MSVKKNERLAVGLALSSPLSISIAVRVVLPLFDGAMLTDAFSFPFLLLACAGGARADVDVDGASFSLSEGGISCEDIRFNRLCRGGGECSTSSSAPELSSTSVLSADVKGEGLDEVDEASKREEEDREKRMLDVEATGGLGFKLGLPSSGAPLTVMEGATCSETLEVALKYSAKA